MGAYSVASGQITQSTKPVSTPTSTPSAVAAKPDSNLLFVATASGSIYAYSVGSGGTMQLANRGTSVATVPNPTSMAMDRSGSLLFVLSASSLELHVFEVDSLNSNGNGYLVPASQGVIRLDQGQPSQVFTTPDNQHLFVALGAGGVDAFALNAGSALVQDRVYIAPLHPGRDRDTAITTDNTFPISLCG